ncbi:MAG: hypoxanthine phosphoribosyltransferase [Butyricicoccaceae bacterium]
MTIEREGYKVHQDILKVMFEEEQLQRKAAEIGAQISRDYAGKNPLIVGILKGSCMFFADLVRRIDIPCTIDFMAVSSYGKGAVSSGEVLIIKDLSYPVTDRHVILVEDILDSGRTLSNLMRVLSARDAASVEICTLLDKPSGRKVEVDAKYSGFEVPDAFLVGYGLDYAEKYRNLPYIGILKPEVYQ